MLDVKTTFGDRLRPGVQLRRAEARDVGALQEFGREAFTRTFGHCYPPEELDFFLSGPAYDADTFLGWIAEADKHHVLLAVEVESADGTSNDSDRIVGYSLSSAECHLPHKDVTPNCLELCRLYVAPSEFGQGTAQALMHEALLWMDGKRQTRTSGIGSLSRGGIWLGVYSENFRAQKFYAKFGFEVVGEYEYIVGRCRDREFIMQMQEPMKSSF